MLSVNVGLMGFRRLLESPSDLTRRDDDLLLGLKILYLLIIPVLKNIHQPTWVAFLSSEAAADLLSSF